MEQLRIIAASSLYVGAVQGDQSIFPSAHYPGPVTLDNMLGLAGCYPAPVAVQPRKRLIAKWITRNQHGLLETTDKLKKYNHKFFATRKDAAKFLRRVRRLIHAARRRDNAELWARLLHG